MADIQSTGGLLSYLQISDPLLRVELFREIRLAQEDTKYREDDAWAKYTVQPGDTLSPEFVAYKVYSIDTLKWLIMVAASLDNSRERLTAGTTLYLPTTTWLRQRIRYYASLPERS